MKTLFLACLILLVVIGQVKADSSVPTIDTIVDVKPLPTIKTVGELL